MLSVAVAAISTAAILVRAIDDVHPLSIALWRTIFVASLLAPAIHRIDRRDAARIAVAGLFLAIHFTTWFASIELTTVMRSTVLVCTGPVWAGFIEWGALGQRPRGRFWLGLAIAVPGVALMAGSGGTATLAGDLLAAIGGLCAAVYFVLGRTVRQRVGFATYGSLVCAAAAVVLFPVAWGGGVPLIGFSTRDWVLIGALALGPQLLGHNGFNWALRYLPASRVTSLTLLEPVGASLLALAFFGEVPPWLGALGALTAVVGVSLAASRQRPTPPPAVPGAAPTRPLPGRGG